MLIIEIILGDFYRWDIMIIMTIIIMLIIEIILGDLYRGDRKLGHHRKSR